VEKISTIHKKTKTRFFISTQSKLLKTYFVKDNGAEKKNNCLPKYKISDIPETIRNSI